MSARNPTADKDAPPRTPLCAGLQAQACALAAALALGGCATPPPPPPLVALKPPAAFSSPNAASSTAAATTGGAALPSAPAADSAWWRVFNDPLIDALVPRALQGNARLDEAAARLAQARALLRASQAATTPQLGLNAGSNRQGGPLLNAAGSSGTLLTAAASLSWEIDLSGRLAQASAASALDAEARAALLAGARLMVQAELVQTVLALRTLQAERALVQQQLALQAQAVQLDDGRARAGLLPEQAVAEARARLAAARADAAPLALRQAQLSGALALLLGEPAPGFSLSGLPDGAALFARPNTDHERPPADDDRALPLPAEAVPAIPAGIPSTVLARRPDVAAADLGLQAQWQRAGAARRATLPSLQLTASGGQASSDLAGLLTSASRAWGLGALLLTPLLDGGRREAAVGQADAELQAAAANHRQTVLQALQEVEQQLATLSALAEQSRWQQAAVDAAELAVGQARSRVRNGLAAPQAVLVSRQAALQQRRVALQLAGARAQATVGLIRALGGGWGDAPGAALQPSAGPS